MTKDRQGIGKGLEGSKVGRLESSVSQSESHSLSQSNEITPEELRRRVADIKRILALNAMDPSRPPGLLAVTKTIPAEVIEMLPFDEIDGIGENRAGEIFHKFGRLCQKTKFHMIGRLQTNKVAGIISRVSFIQSLDRDSLAEEIHRHASEAGIAARCLVQVNIGREPQKGGVPPELTRDAVRRFSRYSGIRVMGLMAMLPMVANGAESELEGLRPLFRQMRRLFEEVREDATANTSIEVLSMGMSADAVIAAQEGATMARIGSALFGARHG